MNHRVTLFLLLSAIFSCNVIPKNRSPLDIDCYVQYMAGLSLLDYLGRELETNKKALYLDNLKHITGLTKNDVITYLQTIKNDPEQGQLFFKEMSRIIAKKNDTLKE